MDVATYPFSKKVSKANCRTSALRNSFVLDMAILECSVKYRLNVPECQGEIYS